jgi:dTMP kinase
VTERGRFITLEGPEGSGKTTAARHLADWLRGRGVSTVLTKEPGGSQLGEEVRRIVLHMRGMSDDLDPRADALLYAAGRAQHVARLIRPALERGDWVVCARYIDSSLAYQGAGYGNDIDDLRRLQEFATGGLRPDLTLLLDVPVDVGLDRTRRRGEWNRFEDTEELAFFEQVRAAYLKMAAEEPERFEVIDGSGTVEAADAEVQAAVGRRLAP